MPDPPPASERRATLRPRPLLEALVRHGVDFIVLGGIAERLQGVPRTTDDFDIWPRPDGTEGYDDLIRRAVEVTIGDDTIKLIHLEDSIRIKRTLGGPKYLSHLELLRETQEQRRARGLD